MEKFSISTWTFYVSLSPEISFRQVITAKCEKDWAGEFEHTNDILVTFKFIYGYRSLASVGFHNPQFECFRANGEVYLRDFRLFSSVFHFRSTTRKFYKSKSICNTNIIKHTIPFMTVGCILYSSGGKFSAVVSTYANPPHVITPPGNMHHRAENALHKITILNWVCASAIFWHFSNRLRFCNTLEPWSSAVERQRLRVE